MLLEIPDKDFYYYFQYYEHSKFSDRPCITKMNNTDKWQRYLSEEIHNWFLDFNIEYSLSFSKEIREYHDYYRWWIDIPNDSYAILFKLIWL